MTGAIYKKLRHFLTITVAAGVTAVTAPWNAAWAQEGEDALALEEVMVTAQKREQSMQDVPSTVNSALGETLRDYNIFDFTELEKMTPGLDMRKINGRAGSVSLRGVTYNPNSGSSQAVDVYWNDTTTGMLGSGGLFQQIFDIARIEVLRGPQGTLQGRTSPGGTINIITAKPDLNETTGYVRTTFTDNSGNNTQFGASMPVIPGSLAFRFAGVYDKNDMNEAKNILDGNVSENKTSSGRLSLSWAPTDTLSFDLAYQYMENDLNAVTPLAGSSTLPLQPQTLPDIKANEFLGIELQPLINEGEYSNTSLNVQWDVSDNHQLTYVGGYHKVESYNFRDTALGNTNPGVPNPGFTNPQVFDDEDEALSHELRLNSLSNEFWDYTVGLYYGEENGTFLRKQLTSPFAIPINIPTPFDMKDYAIFNHNIFHFSDQLTAQLGVRWQSTDRVIDSVILAAADVPPLGISEGDVMGVLLPNGLGNFESDNFTGSASISYAFDEPEVMIYAKTATSYRPGGATVSSQNLGELATYDEEESWFAELGFKSTLWNGQLRLNGSVFYQDFDNFITRLNRIQINNGGKAKRPAESSITTNGDAEILGMEIFVEALLTENWILSASGSFTSAEFKDGVMLPCSDGNPIPDGTVANTCDVGGQALGVQPKVSMNFSTEYTIPLASSEAYVRALYNFIGEREDVAAPTDDKLDSYGVFDLYFGWRPGQGAWDLSVFARNLFDTDEVNNYLPEWRTRVGSLGTGYWGADLVPPRLLGVSATYNF
jgi:iron complex outermembrane receptor protein